ncbi:MAG: pseudouridine synthase [Pseudomonadota bacterium]
MAKIVLFNKPYDVLSQFRPEAGTRSPRKTVADFVNDRSLKIAGRLDRDSEGLLLLTDDGALIHKITQPDERAGMTKTYWAQVEGVANKGQLMPLVEGKIILNDGPCQPSPAKVIDEPQNLWIRRPPIRVRKTVPTSWIEITLSEGRNRQVRRMLAAVGLPVLRLIRYRIGSWTIDGLPSGQTLLV